MDGTLGLLGGIHGGADGGGGGDGGGVPSCGSILTNSKEDDTMNDQDMLAEVSSSYPVDDDLELGLGLRIGGGGSNAIQEGSRILRPNSCSSSSSSSSVNITNSSIAGFKKSAIDSVSPPNAASVVGWPPIRRAHRMPILANRIKSERKEYSSRAKSYLSVKVNMDGTLIGRKVDLNAHNSYETLARTLENMFYGRQTIGRSRLLSGTSEFVLTYEDKDGDCMLVGDVPWQMFVSSVKRLRILRSPKSRNCI
ncbi:auxin-responsive protein IAA12-like isoform X2 [Cynara cardunculus var. scolymus]|uniref:auxin-responsive protein IAA12-like isoform X2 n=1 Tax=Cynara cardunculus var. scolymus TaxID=59895 RepID=UPI000D62D577|nr:auxin-responsive protein IAA12-like isoform X2 [Cynara cardunculus var. scolymus]